MTARQPKIARLFHRIRRRKVFRTAAMYAALGWGVVEVTSTTFPLLGLPERAPRLVLATVLAGFPLALVLSWFYQWTPGGLVAEGAAQDAPPTRPDPGAEAGRSIVVLPFESMSVDSSDTYLADGLTEEISADLSAIRSLRVISRTSATQYRGTTVPAGTIATELSVRYVLEGSVRKAGDELRITAQLIDAHTDTQLWAHKYAGTMADVFDLQERVSRSIVDSLSLRLSDSEERALATHGIPDVRAFELYLRARQKIYDLTRDGLERAQTYLERALEIAGDNATILGQLAHVHYQYWNVGIRLDEEDLQKAREYAERARDLDPHSADHQFVLGQLEVTGGDVRRALSHFEAALALDPAHSDTLAWYPIYASVLGWEERTRSTLGQLARLDPLHPFNQSIPLWLEIRQGRYDVAVRLAEAERGLRPSHVLTEFAYAWALAGIGRLQEAVDVIVRAAHPEGGLLSTLALITAYGWAGDKESMARLESPDVQRWARKDIIFSLWLAEAHAAAGDKEVALDWLASSVEHGNTNYPHLSGSNVFLAPLRGTQRFHEIIRTVHQPRET